METKSTYCENACPHNNTARDIVTDSNGEDHFRVNTKELNCLAGWKNVAKTRTAFENAMKNGRNCCYLPLYNRG